MVWYGVEQGPMVWYGMVWYGMVWTRIPLLMTHPTHFPGGIIKGPSTPARLPGWGQPDSLALIQAGFKPCFRKVLLFWPHKINLDP